MPLLEDIGYMPKEKYSFGDEILDYTQALAAKFDLYRDACFQTGVTETRWDDDAQRWIVTTDRGDDMRARFVVHVHGRPEPAEAAGRRRASTRSRATPSTPAAGTTSTPAAVRTATSPACATSASASSAPARPAIQCVPHLAEAAQHLYVFQRTPSSVDVRGQPPDRSRLGQVLHAGLAAGADHRTSTCSSAAAIKRSISSTTAGRTSSASWPRSSRRTAAATISPEDAARAAELADFEKMESIRARVDAIVDDKQTAEALKPYYRQFCKRPCFHDEYLPTFNRPNVTLVEHRRSRVSREITENAVVVGGETYEVDCLIFASGFEVGTSYSRRSGFETVGRDGVKLSDKWADGPKTFHGFQSRRLPERLLHGHHADRPHAEHHADAPRASSAHRLRPRRVRPHATRTSVETSDAGRSRLADRDAAHGHGHQGLLRGVHARATTTTRATSARAAGC